MAGGKLFGGSNITVLLQNNERLPCSSEVYDSLWLHATDPPSFQGSKSVVSFENGGRGSSSSNRAITDRPFFQGLMEKEETVGDDDLYEACFHQQGNNKKRRLTSEQVQFLERNFETENKLEPERKAQLAKELGLQPRQVAIWFQNRRARFKTKQLEKEYGALKSSYDKLKGDYDNLLQQNDKLREKVNSLKNKLNPRDNKEKGNSSSDDKSPSCPNNKEEEPIITMMDLDLASNAASSSCDKNKNNNNIMVTSLTCKQEDANSAKSDVLDELEPDQSDFSQDDEEDNLSENLLNLPCLPKVEDECYNHEPPPLPPSENACGFGFPVDQDQAFCFWPY